MERSLVTAWGLLEEAGKLAHRLPVGKIDRQVILDELEGARHHVVRALGDLPGFDDSLLPKRARRYLRELRPPKCITCLVQAAFGLLLDPETGHSAEVCRALHHLDRAIVILDPELGPKTVRSATDPHERRRMDDWLVQLHADVELARLEASKALAGTRAHPGAERN